MKLRNNSNLLWAYFFIAPTMLGVIILNIYPIFQTIYLTFTQVEGLRRDVFNWVGFANYREAFRDPVIWQALVNTLIFTVVSVPISIVLSLILANLLNQKIRLKGIYRSIFFIPVAIPPIALGLVWNFLFEVEFGILNLLLKAKVLWLSSGSIAIYSIAGVAVWMVLGYYIILFIAGLQAVPVSFLEAAKIDGAGPIRRFVSVTIPLVSPTIFMVTVLATISGLQIFDLPMVMVNVQNPAYPKVRPILEFFFRYTFLSGRPGYASVAIVLLLAIIIIITTIQFRVQKKWVHYD